MLIFELARLVDGEIVGESNSKINKVASIDEAEENDLAFCLEEKNFNKVSTTKAKAVVVPKNFKEKTSKILIKVENTRIAMTKILKLYSLNNLIKEEIHKTAVILDNVKLGENLSIGAYVVIDEEVSIGSNVKIFPHVYIGRGSKIGNNTILYSNVSIYHNVSIGNNVIIHSGAVIGADGFGFVPVGDVYEKIPQIGGVVIEDDVEIGAGTAIDRGTIENTVIGQGSKIDDLVMVGHNCKIGKNCVLVAQAGLAGSTILEDNVSMGGQSGTKGHLKVGSKSIAMARAGITKDIESGQIVSGFPARDHKQEMKAEANLRKLPELLEKVKFCLRCKFR